MVIRYFNSIQEKFFKSILPFLLLFTPLLLLFTVMVQHTFILMHVRDPLHYQLDLLPHPRVDAVSGGPPSPVC